MKPFDPDEGLDKLAMMKGRLLKGGGAGFGRDREDIVERLCEREDTVFRFPPPESSEELNKAEEEERSEWGRAAGWLRMSGLRSGFKRSGSARSWARSCRRIRSSVRMLGRLREGGGSDEEGDG